MQFLFVFFSFLKSRTLRAAAMSACLQSPLKKKLSWFRNVEFPLSIGWSYIFGTKKHCCRRLSATLVYAKSTRRYEIKDVLKPASEHVRRGGALTLMMTVLGWYHVDRKINMIYFGNVVTDVSEFFTMTLARFVFGICYPSEIKFKIPVFQFWVLPNNLEK